MDEPILMKLSKQDTGGHQEFSPGQKNIKGDNLKEDNYLFEIGRFLSLWFDSQLKWEDNLWIIF